MHLSFKKTFSRSLHAFRFILDFHTFASLAFTANIFLQLSFRNITKIYS